METPSTPPFPVPQPPPVQKASRFSKILVLLLIGLVVGASIGFAVTYVVLSGRISTLESEVYGQSGTLISYPNATYFVGDNISLSNLYANVKSSVVVIRDLEPNYNMFGQLVGYSLQQGSGFLVTVNNQQVIVTNNHVISGAINITVTFADGTSYSAKVLGADPLADLAVISVNSMPSGFSSLTLASSKTLKVGDPVVAVGSPYGLSGTLTTGVVSALGRTITETDDSGNSGVTIPNIIQTSTAINPGNSGGPLLDYSGHVVGITTAAVSSSEGLGFAIPSDTILREINSLVSTGAYNNHPSLGITATDMNYQIAQAMGTSTTYGVLVEQASSGNGLKGGSTTQRILGSTVTIGGDIIIAVNGQRITNTDDLLSYLEQYTTPGQTAQITVIRAGQSQTISVTIGRQS